MIYFVVMLVILYILSCDVPGLYITRCLYALTLALSIILLRADTFLMK